MLTTLKTMIREERAASAIRCGVIALFALIGIALNLVLIGESLPRVLAAAAAGVP
ncbi:MAG: hypothetical protein ACOYJQ_15500 [Pseudochelatococcus sp.]|jgi:hypothetical protein|uniref:hypothetical protein n=1 Tax=Pseudochelatococcus sp. TaxID=2020869 RepID=UPI003D8E7424